MEVAAGAPHPRARKVLADRSAKIRKRRAGAVAFRHRSGPVDRWQRSEERRVGKEWIFRWRGERSNKSSAWSNAAVREGTGAVATPFDCTDPRTPAKLPSALV